MFEATVAPFTGLGRDRLANALSMSLPIISSCFGLRHPVVVMPCDSEELGEAFMHFLYVCLGYFPFGANSACLL